MSNVSFFLTPENPTTKIRLGHNCLITLEFWGETHGDWIHLSSREVSCIYMSIKPYKNFDRVKTEQKVSELVGLFSKDYNLVLDINSVDCVSTEVFTNEFSTLIGRFIPKNYFSSDKDTLTLAQSLKKMTSNYRNKGLVYKFRVWNGDLDQRHNAKVVDTREETIGYDWVQDFSTRETTDRDFYLVSNNKVDFEVVLDFEVARKYYYCLPFQSWLDASPQIREVLFGI